MLPPDQRLSAIGRLRQGEDVRAVARELGVPAGALSALWREAQKQARRESWERLRPLVAEAATNEGFTSRVKHAFAFPEIGSAKSYHPDCVWFHGSPEEQNTVAIFEIDGEVSPKHRAGGAALANIVASDCPGMGSVGQVGQLIAYGANFSEQVRRVSSYVDRILKGAKPADLPVEQPTKFELIINIKTAKTLRLTIPRSVLLQADQVIE
jgi:hypothetical protein